MVFRFFTFNLRLQTHEYPAVLFTSLQIIPKNHCSPGLVANLSQNDRNILAEHPLDKCLIHLQDPLRKVEQNYRPDDVDSHDQGLQKALSRLLHTLQVHEAALDLRSTVETDNVATELANFSFIQRGRYNYEHYCVLSPLVVKQAPGVDIWNAVFDLIATVSRTTPPTSIPVSFNGTPITKSSSSIQGSEQTRKIIESAMFHEIKRCTYRDVDGFFEKYFERRRWSHKKQNNLQYNLQTIQTRTTDRFSQFARRGCRMGLTVSFSKHTSFGFTRHFIYDKKY